MANATNNLQQMIVPYCERLATGSEPVNTLSNAGFVLVVVYGIYLWRQQSTAAAIAPTGTTLPASTVRIQLPRAAIYGLLMLPLMIAAGSALFHAMPGHITHLLDIVPVCLFALLAFWLCLTRYQWPYWKITGLLVLWIATTAIAAGWPEVLAHSLFYLPTLIVLVYLAIALKPQRSRSTLLALTFGCALLFRAIDLPICALGENTGSNTWAGNLGTHFLWHLLTAVACILCLQLVLGRSPE